MQSRGAYQPAKHIGDRDMKHKWLMRPLATDLLAAALIGAMALAHNEVGEYTTRRETVASRCEVSLRQEKPSQTRGL